MTTIDLKKIKRLSSPPSFLRGRRLMMPLIWPALTLFIFLLISLNPERLAFLTHPSTKIIIIGLALLLFFLDWFSYPKTFEVFDGTDHIIIRKGRLIRSIPLEEIAYIYETDFKSASSQDGLLLGGFSGLVFSTFLEFFNEERNFSSFTNIVTVGLERFTPFGQSIQFLLPPREVLGSDINGESMTTLILRDRIEKAKEAANARHYYPGQRKLSAEPKEAFATRFIIPFTYALLLFIILILIFTPSNLSLLFIGSLFCGFALLYWGLQKRIFKNVVDHVYLEDNYLRLQKGHQETRLSLDEIVKVREINSLFGTGEQRFYLRNNLVELRTESVSPFGYEVRFFLPQAFERESYFFGASLRLADDQKHPLTLYLIERILAEKR